MADDRDREDDRFAIRGEHPEARVFRLAASLSDYDPTQRRRTVGAMRTVGVAVLLVAVLLIAWGWWRL